MFENFVIKSGLLVVIAATLVFYTVNSWADNSGWASPAHEAIGEISLNGLVLGVYLLSGNLADKQIESFNESLQKKEPSGIITYCRRIIDIPRGTVRGNHSYGGLCLLEKNGKQERIAVCNDELVGHFNMLPIKSFDPSISMYIDDDTLALSKFVVEHCTAG